MKIIYTNKWENITPRHIQIWTSAYPAISITQELSKMESWINANPKNKKSNWERFIVNWLTKAQDKAPTNGTKNNESLVASQKRYEESKKSLDDKLKVNPVSEDQLLKQFSLTFPKTREGALRWASGQRYMQRESTQLKNTSSLIYKQWVAHGKLAKKYFGESLIKEVWKETAPSVKKETDLNAMIQQAQQIEKEKS